MSIRMYRAFFGALGLLTSLMTAPLLAQEGKTADPWSHWQFLVGTWEGGGSGEPGEGLGGFSFAFDLDEKILVRKSRVDYPAKPGEKTGLSHRDLLIVYPSAAGANFRAIYFDSEGHVINYGVTFPEQQPSVIFESDPSQPGPRFRLAYDLDSKGTLKITFSIAAPGGPFKVYVQGTAQRKR